MDSKAVCADAGVDGAGVPAQDPVALYDALISTTPTLFACGFLKSTLVHFATTRFRRTWDRLKRRCSGSVRCGT